MSGPEARNTKAGGERSASVGAGSFYVIGGTLPRETPSYVERRADDELYEALREGKFSYVLTARQMGKSSLMVRTAGRLREAGIAVAILDLTAVGQNLDAEQWYDGLLGLLGRTLEVEDELEAFWLEHPRLGPLQRWMAALHDVVLAKVHSPVVLFIDEIDAVRSLPFSADEFFAAIRECYNRRSEDPAFRRLGFCLLGVASPSDLIRDTRTTPFNIGRRIDLDDFTAEEAAPLAAGLEAGGSAAAGRSKCEAGALLDRVLYWTGGHPYLTQRLCHAVATDGTVRGPAGVDRLCSGLFLSASAREQDDNLLFVRERLLRSEADRASLLDLYGQVRRNGSVPLDESNPLVGILRLSGIVRVSEPTHSPRSRSRRTPTLSVRNRVYRRVFDRDWVTQHMPDAERRRQHAAYRRGVARATMLSAVIIGLLASLAGTALRLAGERSRALIAAGDVLYASQMNLAHQAVTSGKIARARRLLEQHRPRDGQPDRRDFVWRYLSRLCRSQDRHTFPARAGEVNSVSFSPDGNVLAAGAADGTVQLRDARTSALLETLAAHEGITRATFSPSGRLLATVGGKDGTVKLWDLRTRPAALRLQFSTFRRPYPCIFFTPDGKTLIAGADDNTVRLWDIGTDRAERLIGPSPGGSRVIPIQAAGPMALSADGSTLAVCAAGADGGRVTLWDIRFGGVQRLPSSLPPVEGLVEAVAFSADGRLIATGGRATLRLWDASTGRVLRTLKGHEGVVLGLAFSPEKRVLASSGLDATVRLWDPESGRPLASLQGHTGRVACITFSPDGRTLASGSRDRTTRLWDVDDARMPSNRSEASEAEILGAGTESVAAVAFSPDGKLLAEVRASTVSIWNIADRHRAGPPLSRDPGSERFGLRRACQFSPDGRLLAAAGADGSVRLWDVHRRRTVRLVRGNPAVVSALGFAAGGTLVTANGGGSTGAAATRCLWDLRTGRLLETSPGDPSRPQAAVAVSPDGRTIAVTGPEHRVELRDMLSRRRVALLDGNIDVNSLAISPDGRLVAAGETEGSISLWDRATGRQIRRLEAHVGPCLALAFSPDGKTLASGGMDQKVRLWNPTVDQEVATLTGHRDWVWALAFSPDGDLLASGSPDGTVRLWQAAPVAETAVSPRGSPRRFGRQSTR